ncbi:unnamed protein product, partial [Phaeothamnion confervicola]
GLAAVPTAVAYSILAEIDPQVGLRGSWLVMLTMAIFGARTGMVYCNSGAMGSVLVSLVTTAGLEYVFYAFIFAAIAQVVLGFLNVHRLLRLLPESVMLGFVDGLAIVLILAQVKNFQVRSGGLAGSLPAGFDSSSAAGAASRRRRLENSFSVFTDGSEWVGITELGYMLLDIVATVAAILAVWRISSKAPALLAGLAAGTAMEYAIVRAACGGATRTLADVANISGKLPTLVWLYSDINLPPFNIDTLAKIVPTGISLMAVGLIESLMTLRLVNEMTQSRSDARREAVWGGVANGIAAVLGGQGGNSEIGLTMINLKSGGRTRLPALTSGLLLLLVVLVAYRAVNLIPTSAIVGVMVAISVQTFDWSSVPLVWASFVPRRWRGGCVSRRARAISRADAAIIVVVTVVTPLTNLAVAVAAGVGLAVLAYSWKSGDRVSVLAGLRAGVPGKGEPPVVRVYEVSGPVFFASIERFLEQFDHHNDPPLTEVHFNQADLCDYSAVQAINTLGERYGLTGKRLRLHRVRQASMRIMRDANDLLREEVRALDVVLE